jgi:hypothetical protein
MKRPPLVVTLPWYPDWVQAQQSLQNSPRVLLVAKSHGQAPSNTLIGKLVEKTRVSSKAKSDLAEWK